MFSLLVFDWLQLKISRETLAYLTHNAAEIAYNVPFLIETYLGMFLSLSPNVYFVKTLIRINYAASWRLIKVLKFQLGFKIY